VGAERSDGLPFKPSKEFRMTRETAGRLSISLLLLRLSLGLVIMVWAFDKMLNPGHGAAVLLMHAVTTVVSWSAYLKPLENILFFSAWPMLAGFVTLFLLRGEDRIASLGGRRTRLQAEANGSPGEATEDPRR
jgi:hypothetical protein